ncbi:MAG: SPOR domain-containing protein [Firmicutes bacterium]|nr:SPOR domain-containing protein [Bacillota bacterium]
MRGSRRNREGYKKRDKLIKFLTFFVIAPAIGIIFGIGLVNYVILPRFNSDVNKNITEVKEELGKETITDNKVGNKEENNIKKELKIKDVNIYSIQVGSFSELENAKNFLNKVKQSGFSGYILKMENYKLYLGSFLDRKKADEFLDSIDISFEDVFVNENCILGNKIEYQKEDNKNIEEFKMLLETFKKSYDKETDLWIEALTQEDVESLKNEIIKNNNEIEKKINNLADKFKTKDIITLMEGFKNNLNKRKTILANIQKPIDIEVYMEYNKMLLEYLKTIKKG